MKLNKTEQKAIIEILEGSKQEIKNNIDLLAKAYLEITGRKVCRTCPSDIQYMILSLKNQLNMTQFKFKRPLAMYKNKKGDTTTISNGNMTDEKAIEFLKTNPERITLFDVYPSNWAELIVGGVKKVSKEETEARLAAEAERQVFLDSVDETEEGVVDNKDNENEAEKEARLAAEAAIGNIKPSREELMKMSLKDLRSKYPEVKATSIKDFVEKVLAE